MSDTPTIHRQNCACGLEVKFRDKHVGRTINCTNCGSALTLQTPEPLFALEEPDIDLPGKADMDFGPAKLVKQKDPDFKADAREARRQRQEQARAERRAGGFWGDALRSLAFLSSIDTAVKLLVLVVLMTIADIAAGIPILGTLCWVIASGVAFTFYFNTIVNSAGGDNDLPDFEWDGWWESAIKPVLTMAFITFVIAAPALGLIIGVPEQPLAAIGALIFMGLLWPVIMLMVALGGGGMMVRIDLAIRTIVSAPVPYLAIWFLLGVAMIFQLLALGAGVGQLPDSVIQLIEAPIIGHAVVNLSAIYLAISVMKIIGLYYRHFSDRFPWDAG